MKLVRLSLILSLVTILGIFTISVTPYVEAYDIPDWIKNLATYWSNGQIDDSTFGTSLDWLIENEVLSTPTSSMDSIQSAFTNSTGTYNVILSGAPWTNSTGTYKLTNVNSAEIQSAFTNSTGTYNVILSGASWTNSTGTYKLVEISE